jgi:23S rRNA pseudouridine1911/1915/1917 synthase
LLHHRPEISNAIYDPKKPISLSRPGIIHRLDKNTSGVMIVAKTQKSLVNLASKMSKKMIKKEYLVLVYGWPKEVGKIHSYLGRSKNDRRKMASYNTIDEGKESITEYQVIKYLGYKNQKIALLKARPLTGRTHQIRLHLQSIGYPVIGDQQYFSKISREISNKYMIERQLLHAEKISFRFKGRDFCFCTKLPKDFQDFLEIFKEKHE